MEPGAATFPSSSFFTINGQRYVLVNMAALPSIMTAQGPSAPASSPSSQPAVSPFSLPPTVMILDGPSATSAPGGTGFALPVTGARPGGTMTNPSGE